MIDAAVTRIEPSQSMPSATPRPSFSTISLRPKKNAAAPIGRLTKKIQCQLIAWVRIPPSSSPSEAPPATTKV